jgi:hypothetical protein
MAGINFGPVKRRFCMLPAYLKLEKINAMLKISP